MDEDNRHHQTTGINGALVARALDRLMAIRSQTAEEVLAFLAASSAAIDTTPWIWPPTGQNILASRVFVDLDVLTRTSDPESPPSQPGRGFEEIDAARYELPASVDQSNRVRWSQLLGTPHHRVLKGAPGSGKSFLTRHAAVERLRHTSDELHAHRLAVADLPATVWVSATALASVDTRLPIWQALTTAAVRSIDLPTRMSLRVQTLLEARLREPSALIVVDAVDEVNPDKYSACRRRLGDVAALPGEVTITCRTLQWELLKHELLPSLAAEEVELAPLTGSHSRALLRQIFKDDGDRGAGVLTLLRHNAGLRHACTTPLRLLFICLLARDGRLAKGTTYAGVYTHLLRALVEGRWRTQRPLWTAHPLKVEQTLTGLTGVAWTLFSSAPTSNRFSWSAWTTAASAQQRMGVPNERLIENLVTLGVLIPAGFDELGDRCWSFAHRTILEYLAARKLAGRPTEEWLTEAKRHFWYAPEWTEVLTFLASAVPDTTPLMIAADGEEDDIFGSMLDLRARFAGVARRVSLPRARRAALEVFGRYLSDDFKESNSWRERSIRALIGRYLEPLLTTALRGAGDDDEGVLLRVFAAEGLGKFGIRDAVVPLVDALQSDAHEYVRGYAAEALGNCEASEAVEPLVLALRADAAPFVRCRAARALEFLDVKDAAGPLADALRVDHDEGVRSAAASAIGHFGGADAIRALIAAVCHDPGDGVRKIAADRLKALQARDATAALSQALLVRWPHEEAAELERSADQPEYRERPLPAEHARQAAARALGEVGGVTAVAPLLDALCNDKSPRVCRSVSGALRRLVTEDRFATMAAPLLMMLRDVQDPGCRRRAAAALGGHSDAFALLSDGLRLDSDADVRKEAAYSLGGFFWSARSEESPLEPLILALSCDPAPRVRVAAALSLRDSRGAATSALADALRGDADEDVRQNAALTLGHSESPEALQPLLTALRSDSQRLVQNAAAEALGNLAEPVAIEPLLEALTQSKAYARDVLRALGRCAVTSRRPIRGKAVASAGWAAAAAIQLNSFGLQLRNRGQLENARVLLHTALSLDRRARGCQHPKIPHRLMNLATVELMLGKPERARHLLDRAWALQVPCADLTAARILTMRLIVALVGPESPGTYLGQLKTILREGKLTNFANTTTAWSIDSLVDAMMPTLNAESYQLLHSLVAVVNGLQNAQVLDKFHQYLTCVPVPLEHQWRKPPPRIDWNGADSDT